VSGRSAALRGEAREPIVQLRDVRRVFGRGESAVRALDGIDLDVHEGDFLAVMGASGSGKSTCMNLVGCLDRPTSGTYRFAGVDVGALEADQLALLRRHSIGFVFQGFNLLARTSAVENVELPLVYQRVGARERRRRALDALERVGLANRAAHAPNELSGGQQQRVAIARAIVTSPRLLVADEPTGNLDSTMSAEVMAMLVRLNTELGITVVMVTHEEEMAAYAKRVVVFRDGRITRDSLVDGVGRAR
jgi:putative ABC transport system ATP-binding protein